MRFFIPSLINCWTQNTSSIDHQPGRKKWQNPARLCKGTRYSQIGTPTWFCSLVSLNYWNLAPWPLTTIGGLVHRTSDTGTTRRFSVYLTPDGMTDRAMVHKPPTCVCLSVCLVWGQGSQEPRSKVTSYSVGQGQCCCCCCCQCQHIGHDIGRCHEMGSTSTCNFCRYLWAIHSTGNNNLLQWSQAIQSWHFGSQSVPSSVPPSLTFKLSVNILSSMCFHNLSCSVRTDGLILHLLICAGVSLMNKPPEDRLLKCAWIILKGEYYIIHVLSLINTILLHESRLDPIEMNIAIT